MVTKHSKGESKEFSSHTHHMHLSSWEKQEQNQPWGYKKKKTVPLPDFLFVFSPRSLSFPLALFL